MPDKLSRQFRFSSPGISRSDGSAELESVMRGTLARHRLGLAGILTVLEGGGD